tara:strand:- start:1062 stop:1205 length:144 start_codon:yes stop_codon:yes gene_type:complete
MRICPKCESKDITTDTKHSITFITGNPPLYICKKCGFSSEMFPEVEE